MENEDRLRTMLSDLGRSTLRGIGKCYKCGTLNGYRGVSCKNKNCDVVFNEAGKKKKQNMEICKLNTGSSTQVFSVRVRDRGPDYRGFVQLPILQPGLDHTDTAYLSQASALCFVESCQRLFNTHVLKCHETGLSEEMSSSCQHIQLAMRCTNEATVLHIDYDALRSLDIPQQMKNGVWQLKTETPGPVVQRVSKSIMAVKCKVTTKHPLGYLHLTFTTTSGKEGFNCTCAVSSKRQPNKGTEVSRKCLHYFSCIAAFASDVKFSEEFSYFVQRERVPEMCTIKIDPEDEEDSRLVDMLTTSIRDAEVEVELQKDAAFVLPDLSSELVGLGGVVEVDIPTELETDLSAQSLVPGPVDTPEASSNTTTNKNKPRKKKVHNSKLVSMKRSPKKDRQKQVVHSYSFATERGDPENTKLCFLDWLASVTERINQVMHYQLSGSPDPLIFHLPHTFFDCLMERVVSHSAGGWRKRLPNLVTTFQRKDSPPLGTFYNYTWHITSLLHAKAIFDTPQMSLNISRSFVKLADGSYEDLDPATLEEGNSRREGERSIRPVELKTFLKIGSYSSDQESPSLLSIDWTPNVLPISKVGELKISFEFGHTNNGRA